MRETGEITAEISTAEIAPEWLTYAEAQKYASLSRTTLWSLGNERLIEVARIGRAVRISRKSLDEFMRKNLV